MELLVLDTYAFIVALVTRATLHHHTDVVIFSCFKNEQHLKIGLSFEPQGSML
jgi:hypothetical protein